MNTTKRIGSVIPCENVAPHTGPYLDYGVILGWQDKQGNACSRKQAVVAIVEMTGKKVGKWGEWAKEYAWELCPFPEELESND